FNCANSSWLEFVNSINSTGHTQPTDKIYQYVNVYLDGERVVHDEFEYGTNLDEIIALVTPKEHCTIAETKYVDCNLTKPYVAGSKVKSYGGDEIYLFSAPQTGYATIITFYCKEDGLDTLLNDATFEIVNSAQTHTIETNHMVDEYYSYLNYEKVYVNGELVTNNTFNVELGKTYIVRCWHSFEDIDTSVEIYLNGDKIAVETLVNYETLIKDYFDNEGIPYHESERKIQNGIYCTVKYYSDEALTHELPANAMFKDYSKIYLKLIPNSTNDLFFTTTKTQTGEISYSWTNKIKDSNYVIIATNYKSVKINGEDFETFHANHPEFYYNSGKHELDITSNGGNIYYIEYEELED
ncbi:MAG: hypothetical protein MJ149_02250, partial [Clostridia bacterium]|nr:hypothetical protein [Clostridia bacterium]